MKVAGEESKARQCGIGDAQCAQLRRAFGGWPPCSSRASRRTRGQSFGLTSARQVDRRRSRKWPWSRSRSATWRAEMRAPGAGAFP
eukprot:3625723-Pyramimonas_sp.AAC.1